MNAVARGMQLTPPRRRCCAPARPTAAAVTAARSAACRLVRMCPPRPPAPAGCPPLSAARRAQAPACAPASPGRWADRGHGKSHWPRSGAHPQRLAMVVAAAPPAATTCYNWGTPACSSCPAGHCCCTPTCLQNLQCAVSLTTLSATGKRSSTCGGHSQRQQHCTTAPLWVG